MKLGGEEIEFTDNSGSVTIASSVMTDLANGEYELIIATDVGSCFATVNVLKKVKISTVEEFLAIENDMVGYYVLANNISIYSGGGNATNYRFNKPLGFVQAGTNPGTNVPFTGIYLVSKNKFFTACRIGWLMSIYRK